MSPFRSKAQQGFMFAKKPKLAKEFAAKTPNFKALPDKVSLTKFKKARAKKAKAPKVGMGARTPWIDSVK